MIPLSTPHCHTLYTDGRNTAEEMVQEALRQGFVSLGFSEHALQTFDFPYALTEESEKDYIQTVQKLKDKYRQQIALYLGIERDMLSTADQSKFDYVLASCHYVETTQGPVAVDGEPERLKDIIRCEFGGDGLLMAKQYYQALGQYIRDYQPDIIGHFDLVVKYSRNGEMFDANSAAYLDIALKALETAFEGCRVMEVNTGALVRSNAPVPYPALPLLKHWKKLGGDVILSSDCHNAPLLSGGYEKGLACIREAGFESILYLNPVPGSLFAQTPV